MPTEIEFLEMFDRVKNDPQRACTLIREDALEACKRFGFTFDPEPVTPEQTEAAHPEWAAAIVEGRLDAQGELIAGVLQRLTAEEDRVGRLENQVESYKGVIEAEQYNSNNHQGRISCLEEEVSRLKLRLAVAADALKKGAS